MTLNINHSPFRPISFFILATLTTLCTIPFGNGQDKGVSDKPQKDIDKVVHAEGPFQARYAFRQSIRTLGSARFRHLRYHALDTVALRAAWEETLGTIPDEEHANAPVKVDRERLQWFVGFLEGRLKTRPPDWWLQGFLRAEAIHRNNVVFHQVDESVCHKTGRDLKVPRDTSVESVGENVRLTVGDQSLTIPAEDFNKLMPKKRPLTTDDLSAYLAPSRCYLAVRSGIGVEEGSFICIERPSGKKLWEMPFWNDVDGVAMSGAPGFYCVAIQESCGRVFAFGMSGGSAFIEGYRADDGSNVVRFATNR